MTKRIETKNITLAKLRVSESNTRKTSVMAGQEQMQASLAAKGQLSPCIVHLSDEKGFYYITDGQRRYLAACALQKDGKLPKNFTLRCEVREAEDAQEISLATNIVRVPMHPADEFEAFNGLAGRGLSVQKIAERFGVSEKKVDQRLRLANAAPEIFQAYRDGDMSLSVLEAYCVTDDTERQLSVFQAIGKTHSEYQVRSRLTEELVKEHDARVKFVTLDKYVKAGGAVTTDLFKENQYISDIALFDKLVAEKVEEVRKTYLDDGWSWVEFFFKPAEVPWGEFHRIAPETVELSGEDQAALEKLNGELEPLSEQNELSDEEWKTVDHLQDQIDEIVDRKRLYTDEKKAELGVVLALDGDDGVCVNRGVGKGKAQTEKAPSKSKGGYSAKHQDRLASQHTLALQAFLEQNEEAAEVLLLAELSQSYFGGVGSRVFAGISRGHVPLGIDQEELKTIKAAMALQDVEISWMKTFGDEEADYIQIVSDMEPKGRKLLLAFLMAVRLNATTHHDAPCRKTIDRAANLIGGDLSLFWQPTAEGHFRHLKKDQIVTDVEDAAGPEVAAKLKGMSKGDMAVAAERLTHDSGWLPETMRGVEGDTSSEPMLQAAE